MSQVESTPAIGISVQCAVSDKRQVVFQCFVPMDCVPADLNAALDKVVLAAERQEARTRLPLAKKELATWTKYAKSATEDVARIDAEREAASELRRERNANRRGDAKLNAQETAHEQKAIAERAQALVNIERSHEEVRQRQEEIAELESTLGG